jgi:hypothetical protein
MQHRVAMGDERVGNDLLVGGIVFSLSPRQEKIVPAREQGLQVFLRLKIQAVKTAEFIEQTSPNDQNVFVGLGH